MITAADLAVLRSRLDAAGTFQKRTAATTGKLVFLLAGFVACIAVPLLTIPWLFWALLPLTAVFLTAAVMVGHEGGHKSFSSSSFQNELLLHLVFPFIGGLSALYWKDKHNVKHHAQPNIDGVDVDLDLWPMAGTRRQHEESSGFRKFLQKHLQAYLFWPLSSLLPMSMRFSSFSFLYRRAKEGKMNGLWWADMIAMVLHHALWLVLPVVAFGVSFPMAFAGYFAIWCLTGLYLTAVFAPAHMGLPIFSSYDDTWRLQLETTRNLKMPRLMKFFFIGLDHQVEHHLFMKMPHQHMPKASPIVKAWAEERGLPYKEIGFGRALVEVTRFVRHSWRHDTPAGVTKDAAPVLASAGAKAANDDASHASLRPGLAA